MVCQVVGAVGERRDPIIGGGRWGDHHHQMEVFCGVVQGFWGSRGGIRRRIGELGVGNYVGRVFWPVGDCQCRGTAGFCVGVVVGQVWGSWGGNGGKQAANRPKLGGYSNFLGGKISRTAICAGR